MMGLAWLAVAALQDDQQSMQDQGDEAKRENVKNEGDVTANIVRKI